jgi:AcrR family transcriptional regulator
MSQGRSGRKESIVEGAAQLFDAAGYHSANMSSVASAVGIAKPTLYHYFGAKDEILFAIHEEFIDMLLSRYEARRGAGLSPSDELRALMTDTFELMDTHRGYLRVFFESHRELTPEAQATIHAKRDRYTEVKFGTIERGVAAGVFRAVDPQLAALAVFGMCNWAYQWYQPGGRLTADELADAFFDLLFRGVGNAET